MRRWVKAAAGTALAGWSRRRGDGLLVLTFHRVRPDEGDAGRPMRNLETRPEDFRGLLEWLGRRGEAMRLEDWIAGGRGKDAFAVTFDDGWKDNLTWAAPVLRELGIPATVFLATGAVDGRRPFWWQGAGMSDGEIERAKVGDGRALAEAESRVVAGGAGSEEFLTWEEVRELGRTADVRFGLHGHRHALMDRMTAEAAAADARECARLVEREVPAEMRSGVFCWPNGNPRADLGAGLEGLGMRAGVSTRWGIARRSMLEGEGRWALPRNNVDGALARDRGLWGWLLLKAKVGMGRQ